MECKVSVQLFSGGFLGKAAAFKTVEEKLASALTQLSVDRVIMGWAPDRSLYEKTAEFLAKKDIEFFLWFPVFSETGGLRNLNPLVDYRNRELRIERTPKDEDFSFCCPADQRNIEKIIDIFEKEFSSIPFTGVFLDKIRYPSFAQGRDAVFSCFCPQCREKYEEKNLDVNEIKSSLSRQYSSPLSISGYQGNGGYAFAVTRISQFFALKAEIILQSLKRICHYFRALNYKIGLDVFAPFLAPFTGQDLISLSALGDFMKPMMYRITHSPAGLPFELNALLREARCAEERQAFCKTLGINAEAPVFDLAFTLRELHSLNAFAACPVCAGIEINRKKGIAEASPGYIEETMEAYAGAGIKEFALSWDLLNAPPENVAKAGEMMEKMALRY